MQGLPWNRIPAQQQCQLARHWQSLRLPSTAQTPRRAQPAGRAGPAGACDGPLHGPLSMTIETCSVAGSADAQHS